VEKIEEKLRHSFWGGPDDYDFNEFALVQPPDPRPYEEWLGGDSDHEGAVRRSPRTDR
jgi:hypothetical protein